MIEKEKLQREREREIYINGVELISSSLSGKKKNKRPSFGIGKNVYFEVEFFTLHLSAFFSPIFLIDVVFDDGIIK